MFEEMVDFLVVLLQKCTALSIKLRLNLGEVVGVIGSHLVELVLHSQDEFVNVLVHLLHGDHVVLVLGVESLLEFTFKVVFVFYNFLTLNDLLFNFWGKFLAVLFFFKLLPIPINFDILLVWSDNFILDLVRTLFLFLLLIDTAFIFVLVSDGLDLSDCHGGFAAELLQQTCKQS